MGEEGEHQLLSQSLTFKTEDLLVGARADREIRQHLSHDLLIGTNQSVHVGPMWIDVTVTVALPSKESITEEVKVADFLQ